MHSDTTRTNDTTVDAPLRDKRVLVTRSQEQAGELVQRLQRLGAVPIVFPTIRILPPADNYVALDAALRQLGTFDWVVFTSVNGVIHVWQRLTALGLDTGAFASVQLAAIGPATAEALTVRGLSVRAMPDQYIAEALLNAIAHPAGQRFLLPRADLARDALRTGLQAASAEVVEVHAYSTTVDEPTPGALAAIETGVDVLTFTSSSTVHNFVEQIGAQRARALAARGRVVVIGPITANTARACGIRVDVVASEYTIAGLVEALLTACQ